MGNTSTKESRGGRDGHEAGGSSRGGGYHGQLPEQRSSRRASHRPDRNMSALNILTGGGVSSSSRREHREREREREEQEDAPFQSRETRAEREQRRLLKERQMRAIERERSMAEEHVDGGFLVATGIYPAAEDWDHSVVRQLQIERKMAPYWRGLGDFEDHWAEHQIIAAARGLEIPPADEVPEGLVPQPLAGRVESPNESIQNLMVPIGGRTLSASSERTGSNPGSSLPSPTSPAPTHSLKPHKRAMAAVMSISSRNASQQEIVPSGPREVNMTPDDPFINGQPREVFLYKDGGECPLCYMYYPRFLNTTRCCGQSICSECFVHIKRPDPHLPEHHGDQPPQEGAEANNSDDTEELIMEPAKCPYCQQPEFGITYEAPPFRRGLVYAAPGLGAMGTAMSSTSSLNTGSLSPTSATTPANANRRRTHSLSANASGVITTDRIRPDWSNKLNAARAQQRRRAAAANALHQAAFFMPGGEQRNSIFGRSTGRFISRRSTRGSENSQAGGASMADPAGARTSSARTGPSREAINAAHLESMMMAEAIRLSLADEEERRKKEEKEAEKQAKKDAKKKEKEDRKANRRKSSISGLTGELAAWRRLVPRFCGSVGFQSGCRWPDGGAGGGNTAASQSTEVLPATTTATSTSSSTSTSTAAVEAAAAAQQQQQQQESSSSRDKGKGVEHAAATSECTSSSQPTSAGPTSSNSSLPIPISQPPRGSSHLRQISNASSISSSGMGESPSGSYPTASAQHGGVHDDHPRGSGLSLADGGKSDDESAGATESMFNFTSLSQMVGVELEQKQKQGGDEAAVAEHHEAATTGSNESDKASVGHLEHVEHVEHPAPATTAGEMMQEKLLADNKEASSSSSTPPAAQSTSVPSAGGALDTIREKNSAATATELATALNITTTEDEAAVVSNNTNTNAHAPRAEPPSVMITPETPAPMSDDRQESKQLGYSN
ncbi:C2H2 zinc finger protein [Apiospora saccharicola]|uniref:C2H2 zinc finger protein n=1 Tax=Apiospora saccharicola TaxID=335842 RepID=A0ABR1UW44_9PEZI